MIEAVLLYLAIMIGYVVVRPSLSYDEDGSLKEFGFGRGGIGGGGGGSGDKRTLFPLWVIAIIVGVLVAFLYSLFGGLAVVDDTRIDRPFRRIQA